MEEKKLPLLRVSGCSGQWPAVPTVPAVPAVPAQDLLASAVGASAAVTVNAVYGSASSFSMKSPVMSEFKTI
jgi:hypothetical protein